MTDKYASEDLYNQFYIREPKERDELYRLYGLTDYTTEERTKLYYVSQSNWITETTRNHLYDSVTGKFFLRGYGTFNDRTNSWFTLDQLLLDAKYSIDGSSIDVSYYSPTNQEEDVWDTNTCSRIRAVKYFDVSDNTLKYLVQYFDLRWRSELQLNSLGYYLDEFAKPLCFTSKQNNSTIKLTAVGSPQTNTLEISYDGVTWSSYTINTVITLQYDQTLYFRGEREYFSLDPTEDYLQFVMSGIIYASGNVNSLLYKSKYTTNFTPAEGDFYKLFADCTALVSAPLLPLTQLNESVYEFMFDGCTSLTSVPQLPATTLADRCYYGMFNGCTSLVRSPDLPAVNPAFHCYNMMFSGCTSLNEIHCKLKFDLSVDDYLTEWWIYGVAATGKFYCDTLGEWPTDDNSFYRGIPIGWTIYIEQPICFENINTGSSTIILKNTVSSDGTALTANYEYTTNNDYENAEWHPYSVGQQILLLQDEKIYFRGSRSSQSSTSYMQFELNGKFNASGNINSLINATDFVNITSLSQYGTYTFYRMFDSCQDLYRCPDLPATTLITSCYEYMFYNCTNIEDIPLLPSKTVVNSAYERMFSGCTSLEYIDSNALPATRTDYDAYWYMFSNCTNLVQPPELPSKQLGSYCYSGMFYGCSSLRWMPELPATTLSQSCYSNMFNGCTSLNTTTELPAPVLVSYCYSNMFYNCHNVDTIVCKAESISDSATNTTSNWLYGTAVSGEFYYYNEDIWTRYSASGIPNGWLDYLAKPLCFENTSSSDVTIKLSQVGEVHPVYKISRDDKTWETYTMGEVITLNSSLGNKIYFKGRKDTSTGSSNYIKFSTSTNSATAIEASGNVNSMLSDNLETYSKILDLTPYGNYCFYDLFTSCRITTAPILPAMTLTPYCYCGMFSYCSKLTVGPILPARSLANECYRNIYRDCTLLNEIHCDAVNNIQATGNVMWTDSYGTLASSGKLYIADLNIWPTDKNTATPEGWGVYVEQPLCIENRDEWNYGTLSLNNTIESGGTALSTISYEYAVGSINDSYRKLKWQPYTVTNNSGTSLELAPRTGLYFRGSRSTQSEKSYLTFNINLPDSYAYGNTNSLLNTDFKHIVSLSTYGSYTFRNLFKNCLGLKTPPSFPANTLASYCYYMTFNGCSDLNTPPKLPSTSLAQRCYLSMFMGCSSMTSMPDLPATTLMSSCYWNMFSGCESITVAKELPATSMVYGCYAFMFRNCIHLTTAPDLPAQTLVDSCYYNMFSGCTRLNNVTCYAESITASSATDNWLYNVASTGTFNCINSSIWTVDSPSGIPLGWTSHIMDTQPLCIRFTTGAATDTITVSLNAVGSYTNYNLQTSADKLNWSSYTPGTQLTIGRSDPLYFRGNRGTGPSDPENNYLQFNIDAGTKTVYLSGNINSLLDNNAAVYSKELDLENYGSYTFKNLFKDCTNIRSITESYNSSYSSLTLPKKLSAGCFYGMFDGCIGLSYSEYSTSKLLPSTTLKANCYNSMFKDCILLNSLCLPATAPAANCYDNMFNGCTSLSEIHCEINTVTNINNFTFTSVSFTNWLQGVHSDGILYCTQPIIFTRDSASGIPVGWNAYCKIDHPLLLGPNDHSVRSEYWWMTSCYTDEITQETFKIYEPSHHSHMLESITPSSSLQEADGDYGCYIPYVKMNIDNDTISSEDTEVDIRAYLDNNLPAMDVELPYEQYQNPTIDYIIGGYGYETGLYGTLSGLPHSEYSLSYSGNYTKVTWSQNGLFNGLYCCVSKEYDGYLGWDMDDYAYISSTSSNNEYSLYNEYMNSDEVPKQNATSSSTFTITALYDEYGNLIPASKYSGTMQIRVNGNVISLYTTGTRSEDLNVYKVSFVKAS